MPRVKLADKYIAEREMICKKLLDIIGTDFYLCDLEADTEKQQAILALKNEIPKYFAVSSITSFKPNLIHEVKRDYLNIVRGVLRQQGYKFESKMAYKKVNDESIGTMKYFIYRIIN